MLNENSPNSPADAQPKFEAGSEEKAQPKPLNKPLTLVICAGGWAIPGLGHILLRRWVRGLLLSVSILAMFALGLGMHGELYRPDSSAAPELMSQMFRTLGMFANAGVGIAYFWAVSSGAGRGVMTAPTFDYGWAYLIVAGLLNYLVVLDAFDIAQGRKP